MDGNTQILVRDMGSKGDQQSWSEIPEGVES